MRFLKQEVFGFWLNSFLIIFSDMEKYIARFTNEMKEYIAEFIFTGNSSEELKTEIKEDFVRVYNIYVDEVNSGITDKLNDEFDKLYPGYFEKNQDKEYWDLYEYNDYMRNGYDKVVDRLNNKKLSDVLDFTIGEELNLIGNYKQNKEITIDFVLRRS